MNNHNSGLIRMFSLSSIVCKIIIEHYLSFLGVYFYLPCDKYDHKNHTEKDFSTCILLFVYYMLVFYLHHYGTSKVYHDYVLVELRFRSLLYI